MPVDQPPVNPHAAQTPIDDIWSTFMDGPDPAGEGTYNPSAGQTNTPSEMSQYPGNPYSMDVNTSHMYSWAQANGVDPTQPPDVPVIPTGGTGGGSGGGSGLTAEQLRIQQEAAFAAFREVLRRWGIPVSKNMINLIQKAVKQGWNSTLFIDHLRHTPEYHEKFVGIRYGEGMTEAAYNSLYSQYRDQAKLVGQQLSRKTFAKALKNGVTAQEFTARAKAVEAIDAWGPMMEGFKETLAANGFTDKAENITRGQLMKFAMGLGPKKWEQLWQETVVGVNLERVAGVTVGTPPKGWGDTSAARGGGSPFTQNVDNDWMHMTRNDMLTVINQVEAGTPGFEVESISGREWRDIGVRMRQFKGQFLSKYGITAKDLLEMELGGPRAAAIADKSQKILAEQQAAFEPRAVPMEAQQVGAPGGGFKDLPQTQ